MIMKENEINQTFLLSFSHHLQLFITGVTLTRDQILIYVGDYDHKD